MATLCELMMLTFATLDGKEPSDDRLSTKISEAHNGRSINKHPHVMKCLLTKFQACILIV